jgi:hypothetical protein
MVLLKMLKNWSFGNYKLRIYLCTRLGINELKVKIKLKRKVTYNFFTN